MGIPLTEERYAAWFDDLWRETPGTTLGEKVAWLREHGTGSECALLQAEQMRLRYRTHRPRILPLPDRDYDRYGRPRRQQPVEVPRPVGRYDTGIGMRVASYAPNTDDDDDDDGERADGEDEETARWRRHHRRGKEAA